MPATTIIVCKRCGGPAPLERGLCSVCEHVVETRELFGLIFDATVARFANERTALTVSAVRAQN